MDKLKNFARKTILFFLNGSNHRIGAYAAQASFFIVIAVVPFMMFLLSMSKFFLQYLSISEADILMQINQLIPMPFGGYIENMFYEVFRNSSGMTVITAATALWLSSRGIMALYQGICNVLDDGELRNYFYARSVSVIYTLLFTVMMFLTLLVFGYGGRIAEYVTEKLYIAGITSNGFARMKEIIFFIILTLLFASFYKIMPRRPGKFREQLPGAALAAVGWLVFSWVYSIYANRSRYASIYGSLTSVILILLWLYFCMNILLYGAEFNHAIETGFFRSNRSGEIAGKAED